MVGSLYALMALGLTMTYATSRFPSFCHGDLMTIGAYVSVVLTGYVLDFVSATLIAIAVTAYINVLLYKFVFKPFIERMTRLLFLMVVSFAVGMIIRSVVAIIAQYYHMLNLKSLFIENVIFRFGGANITDLFFWIVPTTLVIVISFHLLITRTKLGKMMRAAVDNPDLALVRGIDIEKLTTLSYGIAGALAGVAGAFWSVYSYVYPEVGFVAFLMFFAASVLGGLTSFPGTIVGGYIVGFGENVIMDTLNIYLGVEAAYKPLVSFFIIIAILLVRPQGLAGLSLAGLWSRIRE